MALVPDAEAAIFPTVIQTELSGDIFDQRILLEDFRLGLQVNSARVSPGSSRRIDVAEIQEILIHLLDLKRSLRLV
jgi:hypothetical protein